MGAVVQTSGSQTATIDTEHTLATVTAGGKFYLAVDIALLVAGEYVELRVYGKARTGDTERQIWASVFSWNTDDDLVISEEIPSPHHLKVTLKQTDGTGRAFPWAVYQVT